MGLTIQECRDTSAALEKARDEIPLTCRAARMALLRMQRDYKRAADLCERAIAEYEDDARPEIVAAGAIAIGQYVVLGAGCYRVRRVTDTGIEIMVDGKWSWENVDGRTTPLVIVDAEQRT